MYVCSASLTAPAYIADRYTVSEEFENGAFTLKTLQMLSVHTTPEEFQNAPISGQFQLCLSKTWSRND